MPSNGFFLTAMLMSTLGMVGCSSQPIIPSQPVTEVELKLSADDSKNLDVFAQYKLVPGDMLDVLYHILNSEASAASYRISLDDIIHLNFVQSKDMSQTQSVRPDGKITVPYLGQVIAQGKTVEELTQFLQKAYSPIFWNPDIYVTVDNFRNRIEELKKDLHTAPRGLSRLVRISPDGYATFPMLGHIKLAGRTIKNVNEELNRLYNEYLEGLHVDLFLEEHAGSMVYVLGQVEKPGAYEVRRPTNVMEAITMAGGYKSSALLEDAIVVRREGLRVRASKIDLTRSFTEQMQILLLRPDDMVFLPRTRLSQAAEFMKNIGEVLMFRGWGASVGFNYDLAVLSQGNTNTNQYSNQTIQNMTTEALLQNQDQIQNTVSQPIPVQIPQN